MSCSPRPLKRRIAPAPKRPARRPDQRPIPGADGAPSPWPSPAPPRRARPPRTTTMTCLPRPLNGERAFPHAGAVGEAHAGGPRQLARRSARAHLQALRVLIVDRGPQGRHRRPAAPPCVHAPQRRAARASTGEGLAPGPGSSAPPVRAPRPAPAPPATAAPLRRQDCGPACNRSWPEACSACYRSGLDRCPCTGPAQMTRQPQARTDSHCLTGP